MEPLSPELVDELLSADLDGEFDAAARDHGYAPAIARELLDGIPGVAERRDALAAARDATAVTPLAAADRDALVAGASRAARRRRSRRRPRVAAAAAREVRRGRGRPCSSSSVSVLRSRTSRAAVAAVTAAARRAAPASRRTASKRAESGDAPRDASGSDVDLDHAARGVAQLRHRRRRGHVAATGGGRAREPGRADCAAPSRTARRPTRRHRPPASRSKRDALGVDPALVLDGSIVYAGTPGEVFVFRRGNDALDRRRRRRRRHLPPARIPAPAPRDVIARGMYAPCSGNAHSDRRTGPPPEPEGRDREWDRTR